MSATLPYNDCMQEMFGLNRFGIKLGLSSIRNVLEGLGNPQDAFSCVHVAGTNGKGSVSHMLASVFQESGYKTGLYTSPHLLDFRERIRINGKPIPRREVTGFITRHRSMIREISPSFFEMTVAMAFSHFARERWKWPWWRPGWAAGSTPPTSCNRCCR